VPNFAKADCQISLPFATHRLPKNLLISFDPTNNYENDTRARCNLKRNHHTDSHGDLPGDSGGEQVLLDHDVEDAAVEDGVDPVAQEGNRGQEGILDIQKQK